MPGKLDLQPYRGKFGQQLENNRFSQMALGTTILDRHWIFL
jgi:hypothetical protein